MAELSKALLTDEVVARYRTLVARDLAIREVLAKEQEDQAAAQATKAATERRRVEQERRALERNNNIRLLTARFRENLMSQWRWPAEEVQAIEPALKIVFTNLGDDILVDAARCGMLVEAALRTIWRKFDEERRKTGLTLHTHEIVKMLAYMWIEAFQIEVKKTEPPPPAEAK